MSVPAVPASAAPVATRSATLDTHVVWPRIGAMLLDFIPLGVLLYFLEQTVAVIHVTTNDYLGNPSGYVSVVKSISQDSLWIAALCIVYFGAQEILFGRTLGKRIARLRVVDQQGNPASKRALAVRNLLRPIDALPTFIPFGVLTYGLYFIGLISMRVDDKRQRLGDRLGRTLVVRDESTFGVAGEAGFWTQTILTFIGCVAILLGCSEAAHAARPALVVDSTAPDQRTVKVLYETYFSTPVTMNSASGGTITTNMPITVSSIAIGAPQQRGDWLNYPVRFIIDPRFAGGATGHTCTGSLVLRWAGVPGGWQVGGTHVDPSCYK